MGSCGTVDADEEPTSRFLKRWDEKRVREVLGCYEKQTDDEAVVEHDAGGDRERHALA